MSDTAVLLLICVLCAKIQVMTQKTPSFTRIDSILQELIASYEEQQLELRKHSEYQALLLPCLPAQWRHRILLRFENRRENGLQIWTLLTESPLFASQLHQLLPEIEAALAKKLPYPPKLKTRAYPDLWKDFPKIRHPVESKRAAAFTQEEAKAVVAQFLARGFD